MESFLAPFSLYVTEGSPVFGPFMSHLHLEEEKSSGKGTGSSVSGVLDPGMTPGSMLLNAIMKCSSSRAQCLFPSD